MLGSRPLSRTTAFAPRRDSRREKPFHQERPALFVASPNHNPKLPILSISYPSRFPPPACQYRTRPAFRPPLVNIVPVPLSAPASRFPPPQNSPSCQYRTRPASYPPSRFVPAVPLRTRRPASYPLVNIVPVPLRTRPASYPSRFVPVPLSAPPLSPAPPLSAPVPLSAPPLSAPPLSARPSRFPPSPSPLKLSISVMSLFPLPVPFSASLFSGRPGRAWPFRHSCGGAP